MKVMFLSFVLLQILLQLRNSSVPPFEDVGVDNIAPVLTFSLKNKDSLVALLMNVDCKYLD